jgi:hypothetical protein
MFFIFYIMFFMFHIMFLMNTHLCLLRLKSVTKKLFGGKSSSRAFSTDTLFQGCSTAGTRRVEMMRHMDPSLVEEEVEDTSDGKGQDSEEEEEEEEEELELQEEEEHEEEGHYEEEARHYEEEVVGVTDLPQDPHPHADTGLATSFALL